MSFRLFLNSKHWAWILVLLVALIVGGLAPLTTQAQFFDGFTEVEVERTKQGVTDFGGSFTGFVLALLKIVGSLVAVLALAALIIGAVMYIISFGDEGKTATAKKIILYALLGLLILGVAGIVVNVAINFILGN